MNKLKFIPVLAVVSLLSACGQSSKFVTVKAPKFEKEGQEIEVEDFFKGVDTNASALDFNNNKRMSSKEIKSSFRYEDVDTYKRGKDVIRHTVYQEMDEGIAKYDAPHSLISVKGEYGNDTLEENKFTGKQEEIDHKYFDTMYQRVQYGDELCYASVDPKAQAIYMYGIDMDEYDIPSLADNIAKDMVLEYMYLNTMEDVLDALDSASSSEEALAEWKMYQNKNTYTLIYTHDTEPRDVLDSNDSTIVKFTVSGKFERKLQMKFDGNNLKISYYYEDYAIRTYKSNYYENGFYFAEGDVEEMVSRESLQCEMKEKDVSLKELSYEGYQVLYY